MSLPDEKPADDSLGGQLQALARSGMPRRFRAGEVIFSTGEAGDGFYVLASGRVKISAAVGSGEPRQLALIEAGDFFGEMAVLDDAPRSATATAETDVTAAFVGRDHLLHLLQSRPSLALNLIREFSGRMRTLNRKYLDEIIHAERLGIVGRFASTIVHDIKNPLAVISLAAEAAGATDLPESVRLSARKQIERQVARMSGMLNELIDFTRPSNRSAAFDSVNFAPFFRALAEDLQLDIAGREVSVVVVEPLPEIEVRTQTARLSRLLHNLVHNAVDEMPDGGKIFLRAVVDDGELRVEVEDTGPGIAPEIARQLFQPFATHGKAHGTGLGLSICKKIIEDHGGRIWATSRRGKGATFAFTLPLRVNR